MLPLLPAPLRALLEQLERLPAIGEKSAQRIAFYLLREPQDRHEALAKAITGLAGSIRRCRTCSMLADTDECRICKDPSRDAGILCVVEGPLDVLAIERTQEFRGRYHVLGGVLSPLDQIGPEDLTVASLVERVKAPGVKEVILALNPSTEGETTALYLKKLLADAEIPLTRLAHGLPTGAALEFADDLTIARALSGRQRMS